MVAVIIRQRERGWISLGVNSYALFHAIQIQGEDDSVRMAPDGDSVVV